MSRNRARLLLGGLGVFSVVHPSAANIVISGYMANPAGTNDSPNEYVQLVALQDINFTTTPYSVVAATNGTAGISGWAIGGTFTYKFNLTTGSVAAGQVFYVGGNGRVINGTGTTSLSAQTWIKAINTGTTVGDGLGSISPAGVFGDGGQSADAVAVFAGTSVSTAVPIDAAFYGASIGNAFVSTTTGYELPVNDRYAGGKLQTDSFLYTDPKSGEFTRLIGTYNGTTGTWSTARTSTVVSALTQVANIAPAITLVQASALTTNTSNGMVRLAGDTVQISNASSASGYTRDAGVLSNVLITQGLNGTFGQSGLSDGNITPGASQTGTVSFVAASNVLKGAVSSGALTFTLAGGANSGATGAGSFSYPLTATVTTNSAPISQSNLRTDFGATQTAGVTAGASYANLQSTDSGSIVGSGGAARLGTTATLLAGAASDATTVSMAWRTRTTDEAAPATPGGVFTNGGGLASDVVNLTGIAPNSTTTGSTTDTDVFVLQMTYNVEQLAVALGLPGLTDGSQTESTAAASGLINLGWFDGSKWTLAVAGNYLGTPSFKGNLPFESSLFALGNYGVDTNNNVVWAVLNHNSQFAVIPEPTSLAGVFGVTGMTLLMRRKRERQFPPANASAHGG